MSEILKAENLFVTYHDGTEALRGVSFSVQPQERVGIIGPNGAGKTSLMLAVMRGVDFRGRIVVDGVELTGRTADDVRGRCGMTFQDPDDQLFSPTLLDDVAFGPLNQGCEPHAAEAKSRQTIEAVGLEGLEGRCAHHLSGGQKRNATLATIFSMQVKLLLLDEPGANLDFRSRRRLIDLVRRRDEAVLLATHDLDMVGELCGRVMILDSGSIVADGAAGEILGDSGLLSAHGLA
ncbi:MAG TPA: ABC transporter ATP-binding protein [Phycisphaerae bacterium]|nr:ABC transporter ATP-binding protein [Phycisphaerae bacterium]